MNDPMILPPYLRPDRDLIAICSPAGAVDIDLFSPAIEIIKKDGFDVKVMPHAQGRCGSYSAPLADRIHDMRQALTDSTVGAILCGRGGYGAVQTIEEIAPYVNALSPKWLIGFSDITALHSLWHSKGIASIHASMLKGIAKENAWAPISDCLQGRPKSLQLPPHPLNRHGSVRARVAAGNMAVLTSLIGTPYQLPHRGDILIVEDINEPIYKLQRMLWQLRLNGTLATLGALIAGQFTHTAPDANYSDPCQMISDMVKEYDYPVVYDAPIGHIPGNTPIIMSEATLTCDENGAKLVYANVF